MRFLLTAIVLFLAACSNEPSSSTPATSTDSLPAPAPALKAVLPDGGSEFLYMHYWVLDELAGAKMPATGDTAFLQFYPGQVSRVSGSTGCNRINGNIELGAERSLTFGPLATTRKACAAGSIEPDFLQALVRTRAFAVNDTVLYLLSGDTVLLRFRPRRAGEDRSVFVGTGNEPFWSVRVIPAGMQFQLVDGESISTPPVPAGALEGGRQYVATTEQGRLDIRIFDRPCINDMSGDTLPNTVEVRYKGKTYKGCGRYQKSMQ